MTDDPQFMQAIGHAALRVWPDLPRDLQERLFEDAGEKGEIDPSFVITHRATLEERPKLYKTETFRDKKDGCIKVIMKP
jgi:threonine dehydrogenase-like Zn-dependent dehydrogenase